MNFLNLTSLFNRRAVVVARFVASTSTVVDNCNPHPVDARFVCTSTTVQDTAK